MKYHRIDEIRKMIVLPPKFLQTDIQFSFACCFLYSINSEVIDADRQGESPYDFSEKLIQEVRNIKDKIDHSKN